jgi:hypothetical protein
LTNQNTATYHLIKKLFQMERAINFVLTYFVGSSIDNLLVAIVGRFHHKTAPQRTYQSVFTSHIAKKIPILNQLYELEQQRKGKQLYFVS